MENKKIELETMLTMGMQIGIKEGLRIFFEKENERLLTKHNKYLRNTELLLQNYRKFVSHVKDAVYDMKTAQSEAINVLDELDNIVDDETYIASIKKSVERTALIVAHIQKQLQIFEVYCSKSKKPETQRQYDIINMLYITEENYTFNDIAEHFNISTKTVQRSKEDAIKALKYSIFGIESLNLMST